MTPNGCKFIPGVTVGPLPPEYAIGATATASVKFDGPSIGIPHTLEVISKNEAWRELYRVTE